MADRQNYQVAGGCCTSPSGDQNRAKRSVNVGIILAQWPETWQQITLVSAGCVNCQVFC